MSNYRMGLFEQLARIILYIVGSILFGDGAAQSAEFQAGVGAVITAGSFIWWAWRQKSITQQK